MGGFFVEPLSSLLVGLRNTLAFYQLFTGHFSYRSTRTVHWQPPPGPSDTNVICSFNKSKTVLYFHIGVVFLVHTYYI